MPGRGGKRRHEQQDGRGQKKGRTERGRSGWSRDEVDRRARNDATKERRADQGEDGIPRYVVEFSKDEIESEERRPKKKVAILFGYSGSGFKGLQISPKERTIEGELFKACVHAGAVSKANADDPKKISWVRCARTDKGVHAAGNVISAKLIIVDEGIVAKINENLPPEIRVWGIARSANSFSAYNMVDSRIYEFLIPTYCFLPPHPSSFLGQQLEKLAAESNDSEGYQERQREVSDFWSKTEDSLLPLLNQYEPSVQEKALETIFSGTLHRLRRHPAPPKPDAEDAETTPAVQGSGEPLETEPSDIEAEKLREPIKVIKNAYKDLKIAYRIDEARLERVRSALKQFVGTHSFHNYTIKKRKGDPSAKRYIRSFTAAEKPILIDGTEWLSLKVHGQSFMMHQIRKMVFMAAMVVRCGTDQARCFRDSFNSDRMNIPKAPGLGLLLERPIFDQHNEKKVTDNEPKWDKVEFDTFQKEIDAFKQREIYERIYREEQQDALFYHLWSSVDTLRSSQLLYLTSKGVEATEKSAYDTVPIDDLVFGEEHEEQEDS